MECFTLTKLEDTVSTHQHVFMEFQHTMFLGVNCEFVTTFSDLNLVSIVSGHLLNLCSDEVCDFLAGIRLPLFVLQELLADIARQLLPILFHGRWVALN